MGFMGFHVWYIPFFLFKKVTYKPEVSSTNLYKSYIETVYLYINFTCRKLRSIGDLLDQLIFEIVNIFEHVKLKPDFQADSSVVFIGHSNSFYPSWDCT